MYKVWRNMQQIFIGLFNKVTYGEYVLPLYHDNTEAFV